MIKKYVLTLIVIFQSILLFSQNNQEIGETTQQKLKFTNPQAMISKYTKEGKIEIVEDYKIGVLVEKYNVSKKDFGYRIQVYSGLSRTDALKAQGNFNSNYRKISSYLIYQQPNFKIRVGDFEDRLAVNEFFEKMLPTFPGSFIIQDEINFHP